MVTERAPATLTPEQVESFWRDGFLVLEETIGQAERSHLERTLTDLLAREPSRRTSDFGVDKNSTTELRNINHFTRYWIAGTELIRNQNVLSALQDLLGEDIRFHHTKIMLKRPFQGTPISWHQDLASYVEGDERARLIGLGRGLTARDVPMIAAQSYLDDSTDENGCLCVIPGSHTWGLLDISTLAGRTAVDFFAGFDYARGAEVRPVPVRAGSTILFHSLTLHFSGENRSARPRRTPIVQYFAPPKAYTLSSGDDQVDLPFGERLT